MKKTRMMALGALLLTLGLITQALAADFSPKVSFELSDRRVNANPQLKIHVEQDDAEEELGHVTLRIPAGFKVPADAKMENGDSLGEGEIVISVGAGCRKDTPPNPAKAPATLPATLTEQDRTDEQVDRAVRAVWFLDISGVAEIVLEITGSKATGYKLDGDIPANDNTCPPLVFDLNVNSQSGAGVPIVRNPSAAGNKTFKAKFFSQDSAAVSVIKQVIKIKP
jgi:hypothetical protein